MCLDYGHVAAIALKRDGFNMHIIKAPKLACAAPSGDPLSKWHSFDHEEGIVNKGQIMLAYELIKRVSGLQPKSEKEKVCLV